MTIFLPAASEVLFAITLAAAPVAVVLAAITIIATNLYRKSRENHTEED